MLDVSQENRLQGLGQNVGTSEYKVRNANQATAKFLFSWCEGRDARKNFDTSRLMLYN